VGLPNAAERHRGDGRGIGRALILPSDRRALRDEAVQPSVCTGPGLTPVTSTLSGAHSSASASVKFSSAALTAPPAI
jgi:hypothetical protein